MVAHSTYLADEVRGVLLVLLGNDDGILECGIIDLPGLELGDDVQTALLLAPLVEGEGVVLLLGLTRLTRLATFALAGLLAIGGGDLGSGSLAGGSTPSISVVSGVAPLAVLCSGINGGTSLGLELGDRLVSAPALVDLLLGVARRRQSMLLRDGEEYHGSHTSFRSRCGDRTGVRGHGRDHRPDLCPDHDHGLRRLLPRMT